MVIDCHHHLPAADPEGYVEKLRAECARLGIDRVVIMSAGPPEWASNEKVAELQHKNPDLLIGLGYLQLGAVTVKDVDRVCEMGLKGLKFIWPLGNYDADEFMPIYERAAALNLPSLFHLGIVAREPRQHLKNVSMARMRPVFLDRIARRLPELNIIGAHFGNPWYEEAAELARMHPNVFFDLTGSTLKKKQPAYFSELLWWGRNEQYGRMGNNHPYQKVLFGTDVEVELMEDVLNDYRMVLDHLQMSDEFRALVMGKTAARIFGLEA